MAFTFDAATDEVEVLSDGTHLAKCSDCGWSKRTVLGIVRSRALLLNHTFDCEAYR